MLCLFEQDFLKYYTKAGMDTEELEVGVRNSEGWFPPPPNNEISLIFCYADGGSGDIF